jgi:hypothetical protein
VLVTKRCAAAGIEVSMGSVGVCYDNAVCETFHATIKKEKIYRQSWPTRAAARAAIFEYIEGWYNPRRRHSTLGYLSPAAFERHHAELAQAALKAPITGDGSWVSHKSVGVVRGVVEHVACSRRAEVIDVSELFVVRSRPGVLAAAEPAGLACA